MKRLKRLKVVDERCNEVGFGYFSLDDIDAIIEYPARKMSAIVIDGHTVLVKAKAYNIGRAVNDGTIRGVKKK